MKEGWTYKTLGEVATIIGGSTPKSNIEEYWGGSHYWVTPADLKGNKYQGATPRTITDLAIQKTNLQLLPKGTVLLSSRAPIGKVAITTVPMYCNQGFKNIVCSEQLLNEFVYWYLLNKTDYLNSLGRGATFKEISKKATEQIPIPVPPLSEQQRIVSELDLLSSIIEKKKAQLKEYDQLAQSIFYDMFGDPIENPKGWEVKKLGEVCKKITDGTHDTPQRLEKGVKFITGKHIRPFLVDYDNSDYVTEEVHKEIFQRCNPELGDVLYTNIGAGIGNAAINTVEYEFSMKNVALLKPLRSIVNGYFLEFYLNNDKIKTIIIDNYSNGGAQKFLSLKSIAKITVPLPPLSLQQSFAEKIEAIEKQKSLIQQSIAETQTMFDFTMDKYFG